MADMSVIQNPFQQPPVSPLLGINPMSGYMQGLGIPYTQQSANNVLQSQDMQNQTDADKLKMRLESEDPAARAKNSLAQANDEALNNPDLIKSDVDARIAKAQAAAMTSQSDMMAQKADFVYKLGTELETQLSRGGKPYDPMNQVSVDWWKNQQKDAKKVGIDLPDTPDMDAQGNSQLFSKLITKKDSLNNDPRFWQKMQELDKSTASQEKIHAAGNASAEKIASGNNATQVNVANIAAAARTDVQELKNSGLSSSMTGYLISETRQGREIAPELANTLAEEAFTKDPNIKLKIQVTWGIHPEEKDPDKSSPTYGMTLQDYKKNYVEIWKTQNIPKPDPNRAAEYAARNGKKPAPVTSVPASVAATNKATPTSLPAGVGNGDSPRDAQGNVTDGPADLMTPQEWVMVKNAPKNKGLTDNQLRAEWLASPQYQARKGQK